MEVFYSKKNNDLLFSVIHNTIKEEYDLNINENYKNKLNNIMEKMYNRNIQLLNENNSSGVKNIQDLNKVVLRYYYDLKRKLTLQIQQN